MKSRFRLTLLALALALLPNASARAQNVDVWTSNIHNKIFADATPEPTESLSLSAAANEYESAQIALRSDVDLSELSTTCSDLVCKESNAVIESNAVRLRRVGTLRITKNTPNADSIVVRKAPCDVPEILYDESVVSLKANETQVVWITVRVPKGAAPGLYEGTISIKNESFSKNVPITLKVFPFELPDARHLFMTNWWSPGNIAKYHNVEYRSDAYWEMLAKYFKNMGEHRQNVIILQWVPGSNIACVRKKDGTFEYDFSNLERTIQLAEQYGVADRIEFSHVGGIDRKSHSVAFLTARVYDEAKGENVDISVDEWLEPSLKALCDYLKKTGRFERAMLHVADEPYLPDIESWRDASQRVRKIAPDLKQIDAIETMNFTDRLDVWVPKLSHFDRWRKGFEARRNDGEFWYYICCHPVGTYYPNRFMDLPGARVRVLHWINYSEDLVGYLHWGFNYWQGDAFGPPTETYGPGDTHLVYPGKDGPLDSIRWEIERESVEDYEYLKLLENLLAQYKKELDPEKARFIDPKARSMELARRVVPDLTTSTMDPELLEQTRDDLANDIIAASGDLRLVVQTFPEDGKTIYSGPNLVEVYGVTTPGASVTINDAEAEVTSDGFFKRLFYADALGDFPVVVKASLDGTTVQTTRRFTIK